MFHGACMLHAMLGLHGRRGQHASQPDMQG